MSRRRKAREFALQMLFRWEMNREEPAALQASFWQSARAARDTREFANQLFAGAVAHAAETDALLAQHSEHWRLERMAAVDRNILRLAVYELRCTSTPAAVVINEALELAKKFSSEESAAFLNGILDAIHKAAADTR
ncbi:MAG: transcription antitermination factor NusB [Acidobacteriia bacterium]|jgi:N utilization substance protein B|nr:transcription antitermination factor NusB [Terriglobia bacterium]